MLFLNYCGGLSTNDTKTAKLLFPKTERITDDWRQSLDAEGLLVCVEDVPTTVTYHNYRRPGKRCIWNRKSGFATAVAVTKRRLIVFERGKKAVNVTFDSAPWNAVSVSLRDPNTLQVVSNVSEFPNDHEGKVELWFHTPSAQEIYDILSQQAHSSEDR